MSADTITLPGLAVECENLEAERDRLAVEVAGKTAAIECALSHLRGGRDRLALAALERALADAARGMMS